MVTRQQDQQDSQQHEGAGKRDPHGQQQPAPNAHDDHNPQTKGQTRGQKPGAKHGGPSHISDIHGAVTTKYNQVFMLCANTGDMIPDRNGSGLYFRDMCFLDHLELLLSGQHAISLLADAGEGSQAVFELTNPQIELADGRTLPKERLSIKRAYTLHHQINQTIDVHNLDREDVAFDLALRFGSGFQDMLVIRGFLRPPVKRGTICAPAVENSAVTLEYDGADGHARTTALRFSPAPAELRGDTAVFHLHLKPHAVQTITLAIDLKDAGPEKSPTSGGTQTPHTGSGKHSAFDRILATQPKVTTTNPLFDRALRRSLDDVRMLMTASLDDVFVAAGIPWYVALFGRDSCITAFETLAFQPELAPSTLRVLARYQGTEHSAYQDEEPGKILHELRVGETANLHEVPMTPYYGTVDATPWFLMLLAQYTRWTGDMNLFHELRDNVNRALAWMDDNERSTMPGFLTYGSKSERGLVNQGWKDSDNGVVNQDGSLVEPPVALVEAQGYAYQARRDIADLLRHVGENDTAQKLEQQAEALKQRFNERFWVGDTNFYAFAIQRGGRVSQAIASNPGHTLFTRIADDDKAKTVADRLLRDDMFCGWGIRTLSANEVAYNPLDYQVGSVWPHDNALIALGMRRWGFTQHMEQVFTGIFQAATQFTHFRLPEVFDGFSQRQYMRPVEYPVACSPQAWAAGALPMLLTASLGLEPHALTHELHIHRPHLPDWLSQVSISSLKVGDATVDLRYQRDGATTLVAVTGRTGDVDVRVEC